MTKSWLSDFAYPPVMYRPVPFWSWNERTDSEEVRRQVNMMADAGWGGFMIHSRIGLLTPYMGEEWFRAVEAAVDQARKHGLKVWIYDEDKWPSGTCGGDVVSDHPEYRMKALIARPVSDPQPENCIPFGDHINGQQLYVWQSPLGHEHFNGMCYASLMNSQAMQRFVNLAYDPYYERLKQEYGQTVVGHFFDEPAIIFRHRIIQGAVPFDEDVLSLFEKEFGYDPRPHLIKLFQEEPGFAAFRLHFYRAVNRAFEQNFSRRLGGWCRDHGVLCTGHYVYEQGLWEQQLWGVRIMPQYRHADIPGIDHLSLQIDEKVTALQCRSIVNQYNKSRMLSELYGAAGQDLSFEDRKWIGEQQICLGVNLLNPHLALYTMSGCRKRDFPPNLYYQQPWWPKNKVVDDYLSRLCVAMSNGRCPAELAVLHPQESVAALWTPKEDPNHSSDLLDDYDVVESSRKRQIDQINEAFKSLTNILLGSQRQFDYIDEECLEESGRVEIQDDTPVLQVGCATYSLIILPPMVTIRSKTVQFLMQFAESGGKILAIDRFPEWMDGMPSPDLDILRKKVRFLATPEEAPAILKEMIPPAIEIQNGNSETNKYLWIHHRRGEGYELLFIVNTSRRFSQDIRLRWWNKGGSSIYRLNPTDGSQSPVETRQEGFDCFISMKFNPGESYLLLAKNDAPCSASTTTTFHKKTTSNLLIQWQIRPLDDNSLPLDYAFYRIGSNDWSSCPVPVIAIQEFLNGSHYDGPLTLRFCFENRISNRRKVHLVFEHPDQWHLAVNGHTVIYQGLPYWKDIHWLPIDISDKLVSGNNIIECHCPHFQYGDLNSYKDQGRRYGTELEAIYLAGDFSVFGNLIHEHPISSIWDQKGLPPVAVRSLEGPFVLSDPQPLTRGDTTIQGLPFYSGRLCAETDISPYEPGILHLECLAATVASVELDHIHLGDIAWSPYSLPIPRKGCTLSITLYNSLHNLLGPHHGPMGLMPWTCPGNFTGDPYHVRRTIGTQAAWVHAMEKNDQPAFWSHHYLLKQFGMLGACWIEKPE